MTFDYTRLLNAIHEIVQMHEVLAETRWDMIISIVADIQQQEELAEEQLRQDAPQS